MGFQRCLVHGTRYEDYGECAICAHERRLEELADEQVKATREATRALRAPPTSAAPSLREKLASAERCIQADDLPGALIALRQALEIQPDASDVHATYVRAYKAAGELEPARHHARLAWRYGKSPSTAALYAAFSETPEDAWEEIAKAGCVPDGKAAEIARLLLGAGRPTTVDALLQRVSREQAQAQLTQLTATNADPRLRAPFERRLAALRAQDEAAAKTAEADRQARLARAAREKFQADRAQAEAAERAGQEALREAQIKADKASREVLDVVKMFAIFGWFGGCCAGPGFKKVVLEKDFHGLSGPLDACFGLAIVGALAGALLALVVMSVIQGLDRSK